MSIIVEAPPGTSLVEVQPLNQLAFSDFGTVIENPNPARDPASSDGPLPANAARANQGTALKYNDVTDTLDLYSSAPSKVASKLAMSMFVCAPRDLRRSPMTNANLQRSAGGLLPIEILERHPFTTQTFIPLGVSPGEQSSSCYVVIVAPSKPPSPEDEHLPVPRGECSHDHPPGRGLPDLTKLRAFVCRGTQAVTYGAGTWHAPMVVLGKKPIDFVVVQYMNGVGVEDCQEAVLGYPDGQPTINVSIRQTTQKEACNVSANL